ncbi:MAG: ketoacyl-ACP synthase III [Spirochaetales bacterium]|nr:ketoacyl-ACP synthase III [Spirochaetales bacterium]
MKALIRSIGAYIPKNKMTNDAISKIVDTSDEWIVSHTGIKNRYFAADDQANSDLAIEAAKQAIERAKISPEDLELIIVATATGDYKGFPSVACILQEKLGALNAGAFDLAAACTGFVYALEVAKNFIESGHFQNILVVASEKMSSIMNWEDRNTCVLFGDGAAAAVVSRAQEADDDSAIIYSFLRSDGSGADALSIPAGGSRNPIDLERTKKEDLYVYMDGRRVYNFAVKAFTDIIKHICDKCGISLDEVDYIVPHQANIRIIEAAAKRLKQPMEKFYINIDEYANTSAATIPIALNEMQEKGMLKKGNLVLTAGFGGGLTYGGNLIRW